MCKIKGRCKALDLPKTDGRPLYLINLINFEIFLKRFKTQRLGDKGKHSHKWQVGNPSHLKLRKYEWLSLFIGDHSTHTHGG